MKTYMGKQGFVKMWGPPLHLSFYTWRLIDIADISARRDAPGREKSVAK